MEFITLLVIALLCLLSRHTRKFGIFLMALLFLAFPLACITCVALAIYTFNKLTQRNHHVQPRLPKRD